MSHPSPSPPLRERPGPGFALLSVANAAALVRGEEQSWHTCSSKGLPAVANNFLKG